MRNKLLLASTGFVTAAAITGFIASLMYHPGGVRAAFCLGLGAICTYLLARAARD